MSRAIAAVEGTETIPGSGGRPRNPAMRTLCIPWRGKAVPGMSAQKRPVSESRRRCEYWILSQHPGTMRPIPCQRSCSVHSSSFAYLHRIYSYLRTVVQQNCGRRERICARRPRCTRRSSASYVDSMEARPSERARVPNRSLPGTKTPLKSLARRCCMLGRALLSARNGVEGLL